VAERHPDKFFVWIDIEDHADIVGDLDVENFPTLLIQHHELVAFFGTMLPDAGIAHRLVQSTATQSDEVAGTDHQQRRARPVAARLQPAHLAARCDLTRLAADLCRQQVPPGMPRRRCRPPPGCH
jgi:hypothetical protein